VAGEAVETDDLFDDSVKALKKTRGTLKVRVVPAKGLAIDLASRSLPRTGRNEGGRRRTANGERKAL